MKKLGIVLVLIGILCCGGGAYLAYSNSEVTEDTNKIITKDDIKDISSYESYEYTMTYSGEGIQYNAKIDLKNNVFYYEEKEDGEIVYVYLDDTNKIMYMNVDDNWYYKNYLDEDENGDLFQELFSEIINVIKGNASSSKDLENATITDNEDNSYTIAVDEESMVVLFDSNGYLKKIEYKEDNLSTDCEGDTDCVSLVEDTLYIEFNNINNVSLSIPDEVKNNAVLYEYNEKLTEDNSSMLDNVDEAISEVTIEVNNMTYGSLTNENKIYYIQVSGTNSCSSTEYDDLGTAYVVVHYDKDTYSFNYYFTFYNSDGYSMSLTKSDEITNSSITTSNTIINSGNITKQIPSKLGNITENDIVIINKTTSCTA